MLSFPFFIVFLNFLQLCTALWAEVSIQLHLPDRGFLVGLINARHAGFGLMFKGRNINLTGHFKLLIDTGTSKSFHDGCASLSFEYNAVCLHLNIYASKLAAVYYSYADLFADYKYKKVYRADVFPLWYKKS